MLAALCRATPPFSILAVYVHLPSLLTANPSTLVDSCVFFLLGRLLSFVPAESWKEQRFLLRSISPPSVGPPCACRCNSEGKPLCHLLFVLEILRCGHVKSVNGLPIKRMICPETIRLLIPISVSIHSKLHICMCPTYTYDMYAVPGILVAFPFLLCLPLTCSSSIRPYSSQVYLYLSIDISVKRPVHSHTQQTVP